MIPSGNVFTGLRTGAANQVVFPGVPVVPPGAGIRRFRITNLRALPPTPGVGPATIMASIAISGPISIAIVNPVLTVGFVNNGLNFSHFPMGNNLTLKFGEMFPSAFKKRIENAGGPLAAVKQNHPGVLHCTESGFNPDFTAGNTGRYRLGEYRHQARGQDHRHSRQCYVHTRAPRCDVGPDRGGTSTSALRPALRQRRAGHRGGSDCNSGSGRYGDGVVRSSGGSSIRRH